MEFSSTTSPVDTLNWVALVGRRGSAREVLAHIREVETVLENLDAPPAPVDAVDVEAMLDDILGPDDVSSAGENTDLEAILASVDQVLSTLLGTSRLEIKPKEGGRSINSAPAHPEDLVKLMLRGVRYHD